MRELLIRSHLGLGDNLVCNAIVRHYAKTASVTFLCKKHNAPSLVFQWRDDPSIVVFPIKDDAEADACVKHIRGAGGRDVLCLGMYGEKPFRPEIWDREMYRQAKLPFVERWNNFRVDRQPSRELMPPKEPFAFVHDDPSRGFVIDKTRLPNPKKLKLIRPDPTKTDNIYDWWGFIENAKEIHCIDSSFAILCDSLPDLKAEKMEVHLYAREGALPPSYTKPMWQILK